jgi:hypothetical protein
MSAPTMPTLTEPNAPPLSEVQRITNIFVAPSRTFMDIRRSARWWVAWLVMAVFSLTFSLVVAKQIGWEKIQETQIRIGPEKQREQLEKLPPEQQAQQKKFGLMFTKVIGYAYPVFSLIAMLVIALVLWGTFNFGAGARMRFGQSLAVVVYSSLPGIVKAVLGIAVMFAGVDADNYIIQNPVGTNLGYYLNIADTPRFLYSLASSFDAISLWGLWLMATGFAIVGNVKKGTAMAMVFGWWIFVTLVGAGLAAAFS